MLKAALLFSFVASVAYNTVAGVQEEKRSTELSNNFIIEFKKKKQNYPFPLHSNDYVFSRQQTELRSGVSSRQQTTNPSTKQTPTQLSASLMQQQKALGLRSVCQVA